MDFWRHPMTMRERLNKLTVDQSRRLQYAFENQFSQYIEIGDGKFIGVGVQSLKHLKIEESAGTWSYGTIQGKSNEKV